MIEFLYTATPLAVRPARADVRQVAPLMLYGFDVFDPIGFNIDNTDKDSPARNAALMAYYFAAAEFFALYVGALTERLPADMTTDELRAATDYPARRATYLEAGRAYIRAINPGKTDAQLFAVPLSFYGLTVQRLQERAFGGPEAKESIISAAKIDTRVGECLTEYAARAPGTGTAPSPTPTPAPTPTPVHPGIATLTRWRAVLSDARRLETDALNIGQALAGVLAAWREARKVEGR